MMTLLDVRLTIAAGRFDVLPEPELLARLRAVTPKPGKLLMVQPVEPLDSAADTTRSFDAIERVLASEQVDDLLGRLKALGYPERAPDVQDTGDPGSIWWARTSLEVSMNGVSSTLRLGMASDGIRGRGADGLTRTLQVLFGHTPPRHWSDLLLGEDTG